MAHTDTPPPGPDLRQGVPLADVPMAGVLAGHVDGEAVLLARLDDGIHAVGGHCTHYGAPLAEGLVSDGEIRCPWHHACFSLRTGAALRAPAFAPLPRWRTEVVGDTVFVREADTAPLPAPPAPRAAPQRIVIVGGGAAGYAAALRLRELGYDGSLTMLSADPAAPVDRPNLSKDYLAGTAPEDWIPLQGPEFYAEQRIGLRLACEVAAIDPAAHEVRTAAGERFGYDALLLATGAEPRRLPTPGFEHPNVFALRSLGDARAIIAACAQASSVALIGAGFIGLEAAAALRARGLAVHVVAPEAIPMERILGPELGSLFADLHRAHGVVFHLGTTASGYDGQALTLADGSRVVADVVIVGAGVIPRTALASAAGIAVDNGILVDAQLQTSLPGHYAAGDVARYPVAGGERARVEHWVHAQRQGQAAAANLLGANAAFADVPFFWTHHYDLELRFTGNAQGWDEVRIDGALPAHDFTARYYRGGRLIAAASAGRDAENLRIEAQLQA
ncbi:FAD-dependent oxidoreductase [Cognatiluteimonas weifangensis]|uniref:Pyridine nucleotide-disulfide oxidoreductase n=1 Tax=Cognatiluteimonas weifangensis TaxID=2303539 RepID=A0A372DMI7_9GAMM|nr:FAD-dependent oxidoreductase [Luteimonas weifangensis]RFP60795.1 pyridine nucleotide-disulfide oxidoreductase [Luteimonas weifangensis]